MAKSKEIVYEQRSFEVEGLARPPRRTYTPDDVQALHRALEPFIDLSRLRRSVAEGRSVYEAVQVDSPPRELRALLDTLVAVLTPTQREQIKGPADVAGLLMVDMAFLDHEEVKTVLLDTKNRVMKIHSLYKGAIDTANIRIGEVFKEAIRYNSAALILAHNHPSFLPEPSPEDILVTRQIVDAGKLLQCECLDHLVIGKGKYVSMRERGLGF